MKRRMGWLGFLGLFALAMAMEVPRASYGLSAEYLRNGECYLLIGEGTFKGIYRLNNPAVTTTPYNPAIQVVKGNEINNTLGFDVDLNRVLYTFTEKADVVWTYDKAPLYRQVLDNSVTNDDSDYGYHTYIHSDHRDWSKRSDGSSCANVYRSGAAGRNIRSEYKRWQPGGYYDYIWTGFKGGGQGKKVAKPAGYTLPAIKTKAAQLGEISGKSWYEIPNESWYSCWKTGKAINHGKTQFYYVMGDRVRAKYHNYYLYRWNPKSPDSDNPGYGRNAGGVIEGSPVAQTKEEKVSREVFAGCLDGCGGASGSGDAVADAKLSDTAFQPPLKGGKERTYFYSRTSGGTDYSIQITEGGKTKSYPRNSKDALIGDPDSTDTFWLEISLRDKARDFVYALGTKTIKNWYKQVTGENLGNSEISAICVSNQWDQKGGIIYAYDRTKKLVYKFERNETSGNPFAGNGAYTSYSISKIMSEIGARTDSEIDDMCADGFGSLYFAMSHPAKSESHWNPRAYFKLSDAIDVKYLKSSEGYVEFQLLYRQGYGKVVFSRDYLSGKCTEIGRKNYAEKYYNLTVRIPNAGWEELKTLGKSFSLYPSVLIKWKATVSGKTCTNSANNVGFFRNEYGLGVGKFTGYYEYSYTNPGLAKIAVINVPTPPQVISLEGQKSFLDIIGPYKKLFPMPDYNKRSTNQNSGLSKEKLQLKTLYWYMVENYPLDDGAQNPLEQPDWDNDGKHGGFVTSIKDPAPKEAAHPNGVEYHWATWQVMDLNDCPCLELIQRSEEHSPQNYFYAAVGGKYIMTCAVKYNWYDYDSLAFGSTVDDLESVLKKDTWAIPVKKDSFLHQTSSDRLKQIKSTSDFAFMNNPIDPATKEVVIDPETKEPLDYSRILYLTNPDGSKGGSCDYMAMETMVLAGSPPPQATPYVALLSRCDVMPGYDENKYLKDSTYWHQLPATSYHGLESGESYYWCLNVASQTNLFKDISRCNNITNPNSNQYNFVASELLNSNSSLYANGDRNIKFRNNSGDLRWKGPIIYSASLEMYVPDSNSNGFKEVFKAIELSDKGGSASGGKFNGEVLPKPCSVDEVFKENSLLYVKTNEMVSTDPLEAVLKIEMSRMFQYKVDVLQDDGTIASKGVWGPMGMLSVVGQTKVVVIDTEPPAFDLKETSPNNLFGITGEKLAAGVGPTGSLKNPSLVKFTLTDNNPWEAVSKSIWDRGAKSKALTLEQHFQNYAYNYGNQRLRKYLNDCYHRDSEIYKKYYNIGENTNIKAKIDDLKRKGKKSSQYNFRPLVCRDAKEVKFMFERALRGKDSGNKAKDGRVSVSLDHSLTKAYSDEKKIGLAFGLTKPGENDYCLRYENGNLKSTYLSIGNSSYVQKGTTDNYSSIIQYQLSTSKINLSGKNDSTVPDGYANNTPGYKPYEFEVSAIDSSGNYITRQKLNLHLNVKDTIPPLAYGSVRDHKKNIMSKFPYQTIKANKEKVNGKVLLDSDKFTPCGGFNDQYYTGSPLAMNKDLAKSSSWKPDSSKNGYINGKSGQPTYQALRQVSKSIVKINDSSLKKQITEGLLNPHPVEDNVECSFDVFCSDNCGGATATMQIKYYSSRDGDEENTLTVTNGYSTAIVNNSSSSNNYSTNKNSGRTTVFRGEQNMFPMAIPITITVKDDAIDWNYSLWSTNNKWGPLSVGKKANNERTFVTTLPVFGSGMNVRTIDKSVRND